MTHSPPPQQPAARATSVALRAVWILRHAKAAPAPPGGADHDRPLAPAGERQAARMAGRIQELAAAAAVPPPATVLCSSALRARATAAAVADALGLAVVVEPAFYRAGVEEIVDRLRWCEDAVASVMVVGHNPALLELVAALAPDGDRALGGRLPPGGLAVVAAALARWANLAPGTGRLAASAFPDT